MTLYHHRFKPFSIDGERLTVAEPAEWERVRELSALSAMQRQGGETRDGRNPETPRILLDCDPFMEWDDFVLNSDGKPIGKCLECGHREKQRARCSRCEGCQDDLEFTDITRDILTLIDSCPNLVFLLRTAHPENVRERWPIEPDGNEKPIFPGAPGKLGRPLPTCSRLKRSNLHLYTETPTQSAADERIPELHKLTGLVGLIGMWAMPLEERINIQKLFCECGYYCDPVVGHVDHQREPADHVVIGNGHPDHVLDLQAQCEEAEVDYWKEPQ